jgi:hypothetical protein
LRAQGGAAQTAKDVHAFPMDAPVVVTQVQSIFHHILWLRAGATLMGYFKEKMLGPACMM